MIFVSDWVRNFVIYGHAWITDIRLDLLFCVAFDDFKFLNQFVPHYGRSIFFLIFSKV